MVSATLRRPRAMSNRILSLGRVQRARATTISSTTRLEVLKLHRGGEDNRGRQQHEWAGGRVVGSVAAGGAPERGGYYSMRTAQMIAAMAWPPLTSGGR